MNTSNKGNVTIEWTVTRKPFVDEKIYFIQQEWNIMIDTDQNVSNGNNVEFDEIGQTLDVLDCYDAEVEVLGTDNNDVEYYIHL